VRRDIDKVVFERAKAGRTWASKTPRVKQVVLDPEGEQINEESNAVGQVRQKMRNRHFNAIARFLIRNVGRPWNKVYAEVCSSADGRSLLGGELREFVQTSVATACWIEGRKIMCNGCNGPGEVVDGLYVHPTSGVLLRKAR